MLPHDIVSGLLYSLGGVAPRLRGHREAKKPAAMRPLILNGHPDPSPQRFCAALASAAYEGAIAAGHEPKLFTTADIPLPASGFVTDFRFGEVYRAFRDASHLTVVFPLWLNRPPAPLRVFMECLADTCEKASAVRPAPLPTRFIVTMEMPSCISAKSSVLVRALSLPGAHPMQTVLIGGVHTISEERRREWILAVATQHAQRENLKAA